MYPMTEKTLSPLESIGIITDAISRTRENIRENSFGFLVWGWFIAIASFMFFALHQYTSFNYYFLPFPVLGLTALIVTVMHRKRHKAVSTQTYISYFLGKMWAVLGACFIIVVFINVSQGLPPFTYTLLIAGIGTFISGWVMKFKPLMAGGIIFLASAIASVYVPGDYKVLLHGIAVVAGYLVPGYLLKKVKHNG